MLAMEETTEKAEYMVLHGGGRGNGTGSRVKGTAYIGDRGNGTTDCPKIIPQTVERKWRGKRYPTIHPN